MRALAVIPPMMLDARQRSLRYVNTNGLMEDPMEEYRERRYINIWSAQEKQIFKEKYLQHPKNFALISSFLEKKVCLFFKHTWVKIFRINPELRILRLTFHRKSASKC